MKAQLENEKKKIVGVQETKAEIDKVNLEIEEAKRSYDFTRAAELQYGKLPELQKRLEEAESKAGKHENSSLLRDEVTADEIAKSSQMDGYPRNETYGKRENQTLESRQRVA